LGQVRGLAELLAIADAVTITVNGLATESAAKAIVCRSAIRALEGVTFDHAVLMHHDTLAVERPPVTSWLVDCRQGDACLGRHQDHLLRPVQIDRACSDDTNQSIENAWVSVLDGTSLSVFARNDDEHRTQRVVDGQGAPGLDVQAPGEVVVGSPLSACQLHT